MTDNKQLQQVNQATWDMVDAFREANRTLADSVMAIQDHNLKFAQNTFLSWMELLTHQTESVQHVQQQGEPQIQKLASIDADLHGLPPGSIYPLA